MKKSIEREYPGDDEWSLGDGDDNWSRSDGNREWRPSNGDGEWRLGDGDDRVFSVAYMLSCLLPLLLIVLCFPSPAPWPASRGSPSSVFTLVLLVVPVMDAVYVKWASRLYGAFDVTVTATVMCGVADALVQGGVIRFTSELPERYMQAVVAGTAALGVLISAIAYFLFILILTVVELLPVVLPLMTLSLMIILNVIILVEALHNPPHIGITLQET